MRVKRQVIMFDAADLAAESVDDLQAAHEEVAALGARLLKAAENPNAVEGFSVYADPAGHPFCLCWG